jgi:hypothetical protein
MFKNSKYRFCGIGILTSTIHLYQKFIFKNQLIMTTKKSTTKNQKDDQLQKLNDYRLKKLVQALSVNSDANMTRIYSAIKSVDYN